MTNQLVQGRNVLDLRPPGDVVRERNADWPEPFTAGEFYDYTVAEIIRVNTTTVHVAIVTDGFPPAAVPYSPPDQWVTVVEEVKASRCPPRTACRRVPSRWPPRRRR